MTVLITGGSGFVGINIIEKILDAGMDVVNYSLTPVPTEAEILFHRKAGQYFYIEGDILNGDSFIQTLNQYNIKSLIHAAAITPDIEHEMKSFSEISSINYNGTLSVLEAAKKVGVEKFFYISSCTVYGETGYIDPLLDEKKSIPLPVNLYEITKYAGERLALRYKTLYDLPVTVCRLGYVFGAWEHYTGLRQTLSVPFQVTKAAYEKTTIHLPRPGVRDWIYSKDVAAAIYHLIQVKELKEDIYNIGSGQVWSIVDWCELLKRKFPDFHYQLQEDSKLWNVDYFGERDIQQLAIDRLKAEGYTPQYSLNEAFGNYMEWLDQTSLFWSIPADQQIVSK